MAFSLSSIKTRLLTIIFIGFAALAITSIVTTQLLSKQIQDYETLLSVDSAHALALGKLNREFKTQVQEWKNVLLRGHNEDDRNKYWQKFLQKQKLIQTQANELLRQQLTPEVATKLKNFTLEHAAILAKYQKGFDTFIATQFDHKVADKSVRGIDREPSILLIESVTLADNEIQLQSEQLAESSKQYQYAILSLVGIVVLLSLGLISQIITRQVTNPLSALIKQLSKVSAGHFDQSIVLPRQDEIGQMSMAIEKVRSKMLDVTEQLASNQSDLNAVSENISKSVNSFTMKANEQFQQALDINGATDQMGLVAGAMSDNIQQANTIADEAAISARKSRDVMQVILSSIQKSSQQIRRTSEVISQLDDDTKNVGSVVDVINSIAEQTNLLALNAAIEAARAGEQGRGFAVVADEVRTLASRTQQSTEEIKTIIVTLQERAMGAVNAIKVGESSVSECESSVNEAAEVLNRVDQAVKEITHRNQDISVSLEQQNALNDTIHTKVDTLRASAEDNKSQANKLTLQNDNLENVRRNLEQQLKKISS